MIRTRFEMRMLPRAYLPVLGLALVVVCVRQYHAYALDLGRWDLLMVTGLIAFAWGLWLVAGLPEAFDRAFARLLDRGVLDLGPTTNRDLEARLRRTAARWGHGLAGVSAVAMLAAFVAAFVQGFALSAGSVVLTLFEVWGAYLGGYYLGHMAAYGRLGGILRRAGVRLRLVPDHADGAGGLAPIGELYLRQARIAALPALFVGTWALVISLSPAYLERYAHWREPYLGLLLFSLTFVYLALVVPMWSLHRRMREERDELLGEADHLSAKISEIEADIKRRLDKHDYDALHDQALKVRLQVRYRALERMPTWPLALGRRAHYLGTLALNVVSLLSGLVTILGVLPGTA